MNIKVRKLTDVSLLREANSFTTNKESKMTLLTAYRTKHSPIRTQIFWITMEDIPLFVASQIVRSHVGIQCYQLSKRTDRGGEDFRVECHDFGQRLDLIAENVDEGLSEKEADDLTQALGEMENEVKAWPSRFDRYAPTALAVLINAEAIMNMSTKRLCAKASPETREVWQAVVSKVSEIDPDLAKHCVPQCMYRGGICPEPKGCGYNKTEIFNKALTEYKKLFT